MTDIRVLLQINHITRSDHRDPDFRIGYANESTFPLQACCGAAGI